MCKFRYHLDVMRGVAGSTSNPVIVRIPAVDVLLCLSDFVERNRL